jgi:hypothetical protein
MNVDHFGIFVTFIVLAIVLSIALLAQANISILPETQYASTHNPVFTDYCKTLNLKC